MSISSIGSGASIPPTAPAAPGAAAPANLRRGFTEEEAKDALRIQDDGEVTGNVYGVEFVPSEYLQSQVEELLNRQDAQLRAALEKNTLEYDDPARDADPWFYDTGRGSMWSNVFEYYRSSEDDREAFIEKTYQSLKKRSDDLILGGGEGVRVTVEQLQTMKDIIWNAYRLSDQTFGNGMRSNWNIQMCDSLALAAIKRDLYAALPEDIAKMAYEREQRHFEAGIRGEARRHNSSWGGARDYDEVRASAKTEKLYFTGSWFDIDDPYSFYADMHKKTLEFDASSPEALTKSVRDFYNWVEDGLKRENAVTAKYWGYAPDRSSEMELLRNTMSFFGFTM